VRTAAALALVGLLVAGLALTVGGLWIPAKAVLAQVLLERAWAAADGGAEQPRPWPWADTWPVARLTLPGGRPLVVLAGASGRTLAFGPGHVDGTARPGEAGNVVVAGHRDTHFHALRDLTPGDELVLEAPGGALRRYAVRSTQIVRYDDARALAPGDDRLTLVTCWPFDALRPGGPLRYVVVAQPVDGVRTAASYLPTNTSTPATSARSPITWGW
jgi:sortase A